ncbi:MAG: NB-ARC domain-containing protein [Phormidesmis sp.]
MSYPNPSSEFSLDFLRQMAKAKRVSAGELKALEIALKKNGSQDVATELGITQAAVRKRLGEVYKKFEIPGKGPGKLASLRALLQSKASESESDAHGIDARSPHVAPFSVAHPSVQATEAADPVAPNLNSAKGLRSFYGRGRELDSLAEWVIGRSGRKLLAICGIGGIGKTALTAQLVRNVSSHFERVVWLSVDKRGEEKPIERLLGEALSRLRNVDFLPVALATPVETLIEQFVDYLDRHRCLVVIDGLERVFMSYSDQTVKSSVRENKASTFDVKRAQQASAYKPGFEAYYALLSSIQVQSSQTDLIGRELANTSEASAAQDAKGASCVVVTSREKPRELLAIADGDNIARLHTLDGLHDDEARALIDSFYLKGDAADYKQLIDRYYGHPMALRLASGTIKDAFFGKIRDFLEQEISVFDDLRSVIKTQFKRLSPSEKEVMYWLAINRDACTIDSLQDDIVAKDHKRNVLYTLSSLQRRFLIEVEQEQNQGGVTSYRMHPMVADYVLDRFIRSVFRDLLRGDLSLFNAHALMKADADDELREFQRQQIVQPILERLNNYCKSLYQAEKLLSRRLDEFREGNRRRLGYAGGNFVNLLVQLSEGQALCEKDFSQLTIWQAYLQGVQLREVNFNKCELNRSVFTETLSDVMAVAFTGANSVSATSASAPLMAAGDATGKIHLWPTRAPAKKCAEWVAHTGWVRAIAFAPNVHLPNPHLLVTGGDDNRLRLWQIPDTTLQGGLQALNYPTQIWQKEVVDWVHAVAVSPDGQMIASGGDANITLYRISDGAEINAFTDEVVAGKANASKGSAGKTVAQSVSQSVQKNRIRALAFSADGQWLASCGDDDVVRVWAVDAAKTPGDETKGLIRLVGHRALIHTVRFSADGKWLVSGGADKTLRVWDLATGAEKARFQRPSDRVRSVAITHSGLLASGGDDCQIRLWDIHTCEHLQDISTQQSRIWSIDFQQQGDKLLLLAGGDKQALMLWEIAGRVGHASENNPNDNNLTEISPNNNNPNGNNPNDNNASVDSLTVRPIRTYRGYTNGIRSVAFLGDQRIIGGGDSGELSVWDRSGALKATLPSHHGRIWSVAVDLENARIASASDDHTIRLWNAKTGQCLTTLAGHNNWVRSVAFSRHGRFLVSTGDDCSIRVWNTASGFCRRNIEKFDAWVRSVVFDPTNSRYVITGGDDEVVKRWDIKEEHPMLLAKHQHRICSVACNGKFVASGSDDATVIVWDVEKKEKVYHFENADLGIKSVTFSPDGRYLAAGGEDQLVYVWDLEADDSEESCLELRPQDYQGRSGGIRSVAFSIDSRYIISAGLDEMIRMGDLQNMADGRAHVMKPLIERDRPYENIKIKDVQGLSDLQVANLMTLGAVNRTHSLLN